jgi:hypothetical protein
MLGTETITSIAVDGQPEMGWNKSSGYRINDGTAW